MDTAKKRLNLEMDYEDLKERSFRQREVASRRAVLEKARIDPQAGEIWSGSTLNVLLSSVLSSPSPTRGPNIPLSQDTLSGLNMTEGVGGGSLAMAKDDGKIEWTDTLMEGSFDTARNQFGEIFSRAMKSARQGEEPNRSTLAELRTNLKSLEGQLDDQVASLSPTSYIESRRLLNKLKEGVKGLSTSSTLASANTSWKRNIRSVADLVGYCQEKGTKFGPAAVSGDRSRYQAAYYAMRAYERGTVQLAAAP